MQGRIDVGATDGLDEGTDHVIVLVTVAVIAHCRLVQRLLDDVDRHTCVGGHRGLRGNLQGGQGPAGIPGGQLDQQFYRVIVDGHRVAQTPRVGDGAAHHRADIVRRERV